jgi:hypothetical protein
LESDLQWIVAADVLAWLGISVATANDTAFVGSCTDAANAFAFRRRKEAGYFDSLTTVPGADVKLELHNAGRFPIYRERGSVDSFASFEAMNIPGNVGSMGQINRLLGVNQKSGRMSASGIFASAQSTLVASLTGLGLAVVTDSRNARPMTVFVEPPTFTCFNSNIAEITFGLRILAAPPGNSDAEDYLITTADTIMNSAISLISGAPSVTSIGSQDIPSYDLVVRVGTSRNP